MGRCAFLLFICAGLLLGGGVMLAVTSAGGLVRVSYYFWTSDLGVELGGIVLVIGAALLCLPTCWLVYLVPYHPRSLTIHATLMCLVIATMMLMSTGLLSLMGLSRALRDVTAVNASMMRALARTFDKPVDTSFTAMQLSLQCCGVESYRDWYLHRPVLPSSCCGQMPRMKIADQCNIPLHQGGCLKPALSELRYLSNSTSILGYCLTLVLAITMFANAYVLTKSLSLNMESPSNKNDHPIHVACFNPHAMNLGALTSPLMMQTQLLPPPPPGSAPAM